VKMPLTFRSRPLLFHSGLACILMVAGALAGYLAREFKLAPYEASSGLSLSALCGFKADAAPCSPLAPMESLVSFNHPEFTLRSREYLDRFATAQGLQDEPAITEFSRQIASGRNQPVRMQVTFPVTRNDLKDVPDALVREIFKQRRFTPVLSVQVKNIDEHEAVRRQAIMLAYARDTLVRSIVLEVLQLARIEAQGLTSQLTSKISDTRWRLVSVSRQIKNLEEIRSKYQDLSPPSGSDQMTSTRETIQIPTNNTMFLSPERQLIGLEAQKAAMTEDLNISTGRQAYASAVEKFTSDMIKRAETEGDAIKVFQDGVAQLDRIDTESTNVDEQYAVADARNRLREVFSMVRGGYLEFPALPLSIYQTGPGLGAVLGGGALLGFLTWLVLFRLFNGRADGRSEETMPVTTP
jgi:hypothetical protein